MHFKSDPINPYEAALNSSLKRVIQRCKMQGGSCKECPFYIADTVSCAAIKVFSGNCINCRSPADWDQSLKERDINIELS